MSEKRFAGRVAIVTGASRGIGAGLAATLAREGASVAVAARSVEQWNERLPGTIHETVAAIEEEGGRALPVRCDVTADEDLENLVATVRAELGTVDVLVNNAALTVPGRPPAPGAERDTERAGGGEASRHKAAPSPEDAVEALRFVNFPLRGFKRHFDINLFASYRLMQLVLPEMIAKGAGSILNITSDASRRPGEGPHENPGGITTFAYGGAKLALEHLTQAVAYEVQGYGVGVNALMPSLPVETPGLKYMAPDLGGEQVPMESFCEAAMRLLATPADELTGYVAYSEDVLHPELGRRGWIGT